MPPAALDPALREALLARIRFYRDLGLTEFYRRPVTEPPDMGGPGLASETWDSTNTESSTQSGASSPDSETGDSTNNRSSLQENSIPDPSIGLFTDVSDNPKERSPIPSRKPATPPAQPFAIIPPDERAAALQAIRDDIGDCTRCALHKGRNKIVFADGSSMARLLFVGEGPGADEDTQGLPFVGRAGQLLNNMIGAMGLKREEVYIANIVKCRPPQNRTPEPDEANTCSPFLFRQIEVVHPEVIVALGATAATYLLGARQPLAALRGRIHNFRGSKLIVTYHPAFLLRDPRQKKEAWADLQIAMRELGLKTPGRT